MIRFTIRDLLWLMVVVGLGVGWWLDHRKLLQLEAQRQSYQALSETLAAELQVKNPAAKITIEVNGESISARRLGPPPATAE